MHQGLKYYFMPQILFYASVLQVKESSAQFLNLPVWNKLEDRCSLPHLNSPWVAVSLSTCAFRCVPYFPRGSHNNPASKHENQPLFAWSPSSKSILDSLTASPYKTTKFSSCFLKGLSRYSFFVCVIHSTYVQIAAWFPEVSLRDQPMHTEYFSHKCCQ